MYLRIPISGGYVCIHAYLYWWQVDLRGLYRQSYMRFVAYICVFVHIYLYPYMAKKNYRQSYMRFVASVMQEPVLFATSIKVISIYMPKETYLCSKF